MANDARQERQLMRQRGAGSRQVNNIDFGFAFNTPSQIRRSRTKSRTPQTATRNTTQFLRTPKETKNHSVSNPPSSTYSPRKIHSARANDRDGGTLSRGQPPSKRRRLSEISNLTNVTSFIPILGLENETIDEAEKATIDHIGRDRFDENTENVEHSPRDALDENKENDDASALSSKGLGHKRRKRKSVGQQRTKRKRTSIESATQNPKLQEPASRPQEDSSNAERGDQTNEVELRAKSSRPNVTKAQEAVTLHNTISLPIVQLWEPSTSSGGAPLPKGRRKRKSITFTRKKRRSTGSASEISASANADFTQPYRDELAASRQEKRIEDRSDSGFEDEQEQADHIKHHDTEISIHDQAKKRKCDEDQAQSDNSEASDQEYYPDEASPEPTPVANRRSKSVPSKQKSKAPSKKASIQNKKNNQSTSTFPVLTHRIANLQQLPTIPEAPEAEETDEFEPSAHPPSFTTRDVPNAVDVLAQICRETVDSTITGFQKQSQTNNISKSSLKQKVDALQNFRAELDTRLFDVSQSLDQRLQLEARLRKNRREKASVQAQWLDVRKRRDQIALRIDAVRRRHWENEIVGRKAWEASEAAMRLEAEIQKSGDAEESDETVNAGGQLEIMLRSLAGDVSSLNGGGVLQRLRRFNAQLERFAGSFEGQ